MDEHKVYWLYNVSPDGNTVIGYQKEPKNVDNVVQVIDYKAYEEAKELLNKAKHKVREMERKLEGGWPLDRHCDE